MKIDVRAAVPADYDRIVALLTQIAALHHEGRPDIFADGGSKFSHDALTRLTEDPDVRIFAADTADVTCAGYLICRVKRTDHAPLLPAAVMWVEDLFVDPACRRQGIATALVERAKALGAERDCARLELNVWAFNEPAIAFYRRCGLTVQRQVMELPL